MAQKIQIRAIALMRKPAEKILSALWKDINAGKYLAILGDDVSGRLPALLFHKVITAVYKKKGFNAPKTLFFLGSRSIDSEKEETRRFINFLEGVGLKKIAKKKKVLFVTDTINHGRHLYPFTQGLKKMGINFDIATIGMVGASSEEIAHMESYLYGKIFWGRKGTPAIYEKHNLTGVERPPRGCSIFANAMRPVSERSPVARKDVKILAQTLLVRKLTEDEIIEACNEICLWAETEEDAELEIKDKLGLAATTVFMGDPPGEDRLFTGTVEHPRKKGWVISIGN